MLAQSHGDQQIELYIPGKIDAVRHGMKRFSELNILRSGLLLMMIVNHVPTSIRLVTDQAFGFFTTAECFVLVSAFPAGTFFRKRTEKLGFAAARSSTIRRAWRIYGAHLVTIAFSFAVGSFLLSDFPGMSSLLDRYLMNPSAAMLGSLALLFRPPLMDILPPVMNTFTSFRAEGRSRWKILNPSSSFVPGSFSSTLETATPSALSTLTIKEAAAIPFAERRQSILP